MLIHVYKTYNNTKLTMLCTLSIWGWSAIPSGQMGVVLVCGDLIIIIIIIFREIFI